LNGTLLQRYVTLRSRLIRLTKIAGRNLRSIKRGKTVQCVVVRKASSAPHKSDGKFVFILDAVSAASDARQMDGQINSVSLRPRRAAVPPLPARVGSSHPLIEQPSRPPAGDHAANERHACPPRCWDILKLLGATRSWTLWFSEEN